MVYLIYKKEVGPGSSVDRALVSEAMCAGSTPAQDIFN